METGLRIYWWALRVNSCLYIFKNVPEDIIFAELAWINNAQASSNGQANGNAKMRGKTNGKEKRKKKLEISSHQHPLSSSPLSSSFPLSSVPTPTELLLITKQLPIYDSVFLFSFLSIIIKALIILFHNGCVIFFFFFPRHFLS